MESGWGFGGSESRGVSKRVLSSTPRSDFGSTHSEWGDTMHLGLELRLSDEMKEHG